MGNSRFVVSDVQKDKGGKYLHHGKMVTGSIKVDDIVVASIDVERRKAIMRAHSATHLLQKALQTVLGDHVHQAGSYVEPDRLRFDFTHYSALTPEELVKVNAIVQNSILEGYNIVTREMPVDEAKAMGATALFSEKYGSTVRVVNMGNYSIELCGGTHLDNTAKVGPFEIESECSVASGVRRIEAITGKACLERMERNQTMLLEAAAKLKTKPIELGSRIQAQLEELRELRRTIEAYKAKETVGEIDRILFGSHNVDGLKVITASVPNADTGRLRQMGDVLRDKDASVVAVLATVNEGKITFLAVCGKNAIAKGVKAGDLVKNVCTICGGKGGGSDQYRRGRSAAKGVVQRINQADGQGKGHENALVERARGDKIGDLAQRCHAQKSSQIPSPLTGVTAALGDHAGEKRRGQPSDDPQNDKLGQQLQSYMVAGHSEQGQKLELIPGQPGQFLRLYLHRHSCKWRFGQGYDTTFSLKLSIRGSKKAPPPGAGKVK